MTAIKHEPRLSWEPQFITHKPLFACPGVKRCRVGCGDGRRTPSDDEVGKEEAEEVDRTLPEVWHASHFLWNLINGSAVCIGAHFHV